MTLAKHQAGGKDGKGDMEGMVGMERGKVGAWVMQGYHLAIKILLLIRCTTAQYFTASLAACVCVSVCECVSVCVS